MPIVDLQRSLRLLGKIRMGEKKRSANGKEFPSKLSKWRLTSPSYELLDIAAQVYGGGVEVWEGAPSEGKQYQVYTETDRLRVVVPPGDNSLLQSYEMWSAGGCTRRCDGMTEELSGSPCLCPADQDERAKLAAKGGACKITTRLKVLLPEIPDIGVWMLESHGYYAAVELAGAEEILQMAAARGAMIPAQLRIDQRTAKRNGETRRYAVPVLELVNITANQLMSGDLPALGGGGNGHALGSPAAAALPAGRVEPRQDAPEARAQTSGPPLPPLPHEDAGAAPVSKLPPTGGGTREINRVAIAAREAGLDDDGRHLLARWASNDRTSSSKELTDDEVGYAIAACARIKAGTARLEESESDVDEDGLVVLVPTLRDTRFGWPVPPEGVAADDDTDPTSPADDPAGDLTSEQIAAMKGPQLVEQLKARGLPLAGKVEELRERLLTACGLGTEPF